MLRRLVFAAAAVASVSSVAASACEEYVFTMDPPTNIRSYPNGPIVCKLPASTLITLGGSHPGNADWFETYACGDDRPGYVHKSQFSRAQGATTIDPPTNIRRSPNGPVMCQLYNYGDFLTVYKAKGDWFATDACGSLGYVHKSQFKISW